MQEENICPSIDPVRETLLLHNQKAKEQFEFARKQNEEWSKEMTGAAKAEYERIRDGGVDFALYNFILHTHPKGFADCETAKESCQRVFEYIYPYLIAMQKQNNILRKLLFKVSENLDAVDLQSFNGVLESPSDYSKWAADQIRKFQEKVRGRSATGIYSADGKQLKLEQGERK